MFNWKKKYINFNTEKRKNAANSFKNDESAGCRSSLFF